MEETTELELEITNFKKRIEKIEYEEKETNQRRCGPDGCQWCKSFIQILCCPCYLIAFLFGFLNELLNSCVKNSTNLWNKMLQTYLEKQEEKQIKDKTVTNWFKTSYHIVFEPYKVVISSFLTIFTQQKCLYYNNITNTNEITTCTMYDNFYAYNNSQLQTAGLVINFVTFSVFIIQYIIEILREHYLIKYLEYSTTIANNSVNLEQFKNDKNQHIFRKLKYFYRVYMKVSQIVLIMYLINIGVSSAVVYNNYLNKSSIIGFVTNSLFVFIKIGSIIEITSEKDNIYYSAYRKQHIHYNALNTKTFDKYNYSYENEDKDKIINAANPYYYDENGIILEIIDEPEMEIVDTISEYDK